MSFFGQNGAGNVSGPASGVSTDNAIVRWDGVTGTALQDSTILIADTSGAMQFQAASGADISWLTDGAGKIGSANANRPDSVNVKTSVNIGLASPETSVASLYISLEPTGNFPVVVDKYVSTATSGSFALQRTARGTKAAPTAIQSNDFISFWGGRGYGTSAFSSSSVVGIAFAAAETFTNSAQGTYVSLEASPVGSATRAAVLRASGGGEVSMRAASGANFIWTTDGAGDIGADGANRPNKTYVKTELNVAGIIMNNTGDGIRFPEEDVAYLQGGNTQNIGGTAGEVQIIGGTYVPVSGTGSAGGIFLLGGVAQGGTASGGPCELYGGNADAGDGGRIYLNSGNSSSGAKGHIEFAIANTAVGRFDSVSGNLVLVNSLEVGNTTLISSTDVQFDQQASAPSAPAAGKTKLYFKTDGKLYKRDSSSETLLEATGDVVGPASATDNALARFDSTTGKLLQNSFVTVADTSGAMAFTGASGAHITWTTDGAGNIGASGATRPDNIYAKSSVVTGTEIALGGGSAPSLGTLSVSGKSVLYNSGAQAEAINIAYGAGPLFRGYRAQGTNAAPTTVVADTILTGLFAHGYDGTNFSSDRASVQLVANSNWQSSGVTDTKIFFNTTTTAGSHTTKVIITADGALEFQQAGGNLLWVSDGLANIGAVGANRPNNVYVKNDVTADGNLIANVVGKGLRVKEGTNARMGSSVLVAGTVTVSNTSITASTRVMVSINTPGGTLGVPYEDSTARVVGTSFQLNSTSVLDTSTIAWLLVEPA
jgi:hypothetical protein